MNGEGVEKAFGLKQGKKYRKLDVYISGLIRQLNRLGLLTRGSCDGHGKRMPSVDLVKESDVDRVVTLLLAAGVKRVNVHQRHVSISSSRQNLLHAAEKLSVVEKKWVDKDVAFLKQQFFYQSLEELLNVSGESGNEEAVRAVVLETLRPYVDYVTVDRSGNVLAQRTYKTGNGPTILLNAHLDTVEEIYPNRTIQKEGNIWASSKGILGADDRAGVAVLLEMAKCLEYSSFNGKVKFIFTVEEEIGLLGAKQIEDFFLWDVDAAITVDRRGTSDIVTSYGAAVKFCDDLYGLFFEEVAAQEGLGAWKCTAGGSSDTRIWAGHGIQSVNLSAGYNYEHTSEEFLDVEACYNTVELIKGVFKHSRKLQKQLKQIERNKLVASIQNSK
ncbi:M20/M25/M40 family metallo-hydrolase [Domibacillus tundrae]|uniref:M20/M25/M40 family metallo-hydrolase n=1 Tax=Domibacillus tundrae TaxID=1587527 RepID=UPI001FE19783|nr:M20/M25/M40 family metallo-hydrolase [Domibacillus tundrae]